jgi:hypothetical protein
MTEHQFEFVSLEAAGQAGTPYLCIWCSKPAELLVFRDEWWDGSAVCHDESCCMYVIAEYGDRRVYHKSYFGVV